MYLMTHSLLSSWLYMLDDEWSEDPMADFLRVLNRESTPTTEAMQNGIDFENLVTDIVNNDYGKSSDIDRSMPHPWYEAAAQVAGRCKGGVLQYKASREIEVNKTQILLNGRLDCLKSGEILDIKFTKEYSRGKYFKSTQHPTYMELIPEAEKFTYIVSNGTDVWKEQYRRDETQDIRPIISDFLNWLKTMGLDATYKKNWKARTWKERHERGNSR